MVGGFPRQREVIRNNHSEEAQPPETYQQTACWMGGGILPRQWPDRFCRPLLGADGGFVCASVGSKPATTSGSRITTDVLVF